MRPVRAICGTIDRTWSNQSLYRDGAEGNLRLETAPGVTSDGHGRYDVGAVTVS